MIDGAVGTFTVAGGHRRVVANRSLDEFADPAGDTPVEDRGSSDGDDGNAPGSPHPAPPLRVTYQWDPHGGTCEACGGTVEDRWRDGDALVCPSCKAW